MGDGDDDGGGGEGSEDVYRDKAEPMLVLLSDSYLEDDNISVCDSRPSSCPAYTLLTTLSTGYCPNEIVNYFGLRRPFYSKQLF